MMCKTIVTALVFSLCFMSASAYSQEAAKKRVLTIGKSTDEILEYQEKLGPIITYLAARLKDMGIERGEVVLTKKNEVSSLIKLLKEREIDIVIESTLPTVLLKRSASAYPILTVWRKGRESYRSLLFVRKDSGIGRASDLKGKIIAFEDPGSTSAYFLPKIILRSKGLNLVKVGSFNSPVPKGTGGLKGARWC